MNNSLKLFIFGLAILFGFQGTAAAAGDDMDKTMEEITAICEQQAKEKEQSEDYIYSCIDEYVEKQAKSMENVENVENTSAK